MTVLQSISLTPGKAVLTCSSCGMDWETPRCRGRYPLTCRECTPADRARTRELARGRRSGGVIVVPSEETARHVAMVDPIKVDAYLRLLDHVNCRLAIEEALPLLKLGRVAAAIERLERVPARGRVVIPAQRNRKAA